MSVDLADFAANQLEKVNEEEAIYLGTGQRILKEGEAIGNVRETCRQHNATEQTY